MARLRRREEAPVVDVRAGLLKLLRSKARRERLTHDDPTFGAYYTRHADAIEAGEPVVFYCWQLPYEWRTGFIGNAEVCVEPDGSLTPVRRVHIAPQEVRYVRPDGSRTDEPRSPRDA